MKIIKRTVLHFILFLKIICKEQQSNSGKKKLFLNHTPKIGFYYLEEKKTLKNCFLNENKKLFKLCTK